MQQQSECECEGEEGMSSLERERRAERIKDEKNKDNIFQSSTGSTS